MATDIIARGMAAKALNQGGGSGEGSTVTSSSINGNIRVNGSEMTVYDDTEILGQISDITGDIADLEADTSIDRVALVAAINAGQKNLIDTSNVPNAVVNGITIVNDNNGSLILKGETSNSSNSILVINIETGNISDINSQIYGQFIKDPGEYVCYCPGLNSQLGFQIYCADSKDGGMVNVLYTQDELTYFTMDTTHKFVWCRIWIKANANFGEEGITIRPMICKKEYWDLTQAYQRYVMSNIELTDAIKDKVGFEDYASSLKSGLVKVSGTSSTGNGVYLSASDKTLRLVPTTDSDIDDEDQVRKAVMTVNIPHMMSNYGINDKDQISDMQNQIDNMSGISMDVLYEGTSYDAEHEDYWNASTPIVLIHPITDYKYIVVCCISEVYGSRFFNSATVFPSTIAEYPIEVGVHDDAVYTWYHFENDSTITGRSGNSDYYISKIIGIK